MFEGVAPTTEQLGELVTAWAAAVDPVPDLRAELVAIGRIADRVAGKQRLRLAQFERSDQVTDRGMAVSVSCWLQRHTGASYASGRRQLHTARILDEVLPRTGGLLRSGELSEDQADILCGAVGVSDVTRRAAAEQEPELIELVRSVPVVDLPRVLRHWRHVVDPVGGEQAEERAYRRRWLQISPTFEGAVAINGVLDAAGGAAVLTAVGALAAPTGPDDRRLKSARQADALAQLARQALDGRHVPEVAGERPHLTVTLDIAALAGQSHHPADIGRFGPVSGGLARMLACDAAVVRVVTDGPSEVLDVGRRTRTVSPALRRALHVRDRGCVFDGCGRPPEWCAAHHVRHWADGGPTNVDNMALLCPAHHRDLHHHGWTLRPGPDGRWITQPPAARRPRADVARREPVN